MYQGGFFVIYVALPTELSGLSTRVGLEPTTHGLKGFTKNDAVTTLLCASLWLKAVDEFITTTYLTGLAYRKEVCMAGDEGTAPSSCGSKPHVSNLSTNPLYLGIL